MVLVGVSVAYAITVALYLLLQRPVTETGERVTPSDLSAHRISHCFVGPCCLCARNTAMSQYVESDIRMATDGPFFGEYVASCATNECGYLG
jgi:hypothetical protein